MKLLTPKEYSAARQAGLLPNYLDAQVRLFWVDGEIMYEVTSLAEPGRSWPVEDRIEQRKHRAGDLRILVELELLPLDVGERHAG